MGWTEQNRCPPRTSGTCSGSISPVIQHDKLHNDKRQPINEIALQHAMNFDKKIRMILLDRMNHAGEHLLLETFNINF